MSLLDTVAAVLATAGAPLKIGELTTRVLAAGWVTSGKTPAATVESRLAVDLKRHGEESQFVRVAPRTYGLRVWGLSPQAAAAAQKTGSMTYLDAAETILKKSGGHAPMHAKEITDRAISVGYLSPNGLTPAQTMYVQLSTDVKRRAARGDESRFSQFPKGLFGLAAWGEGDLRSQIARHNKLVKQQLLDRLHALDPAAFEALIGRLLDELGFEEVVVTQRSGDGGVDVFGVLESAGGVARTRMAVQVKRWRSNVQAPIVQQVRGALGVHDQGLIITTSDFSSGAREEAERSDRVRVSLVNGEQLVGLLIEQGIGVSKSPQELFELAEPESGPA